MIYLPGAMEDVCLFFLSYSLHLGSEGRITYAHTRKLFWALRGVSGNGPSSRCHGHGRRCLNWKWSPRLQLAEECKKNAGLGPIKASAHEYVISAASLTCNGSTEYACSEAFNSEFRVDLFRSKGELNQNTQILRAQLLNFLMLLLFLLFFRM